MAANKLNIFCRALLLHPLRVIEYGFFGRYESRTQSEAWERSVRPEIANSFPWLLYSIAMVWFFLPAAAIASIVRYMAGLNPAVFFFGKDDPK